MHQDRFYLPYTPETPEIWLDGREAHHILHVKRAKLGSAITLFDGKGSEYRARVTEILHDKLKVFIEQSRAVDRESCVDITIAFSVPKGKLAAFLIQKCAELGIKTLVPIFCKRSVVDIRNTSGEKIERWNKIAIEASKQCKRNFVTHIENLIPFSAFVKNVCHYDLPLIACAEPNARTLKRLAIEHPSAKTIVCIIGPEGGFDRSEIEMAEKAGCKAVSIGNSILRVETAAIAISSMLLYAYSE
ncbi:MAG: 16S rRNA (uracil(1498)-N(3))-methyltransferase [Candidatus Brocadia sp.]|nr:MAG: 16S rRNA (uracil(1498)-N(3))-methyltransferase [Candidatus Brocadia sp.]